MGVMGVIFVEGMKGVKTYILEVSLIVFSFIARLRRLKPIHIPSNKKLNTS